MRLVNATNSTEEAQSPTSGVDQKKPFNAFVLAWTIPSGERDVFQGRGGGELNPFVSFQKGYGDFHVSGNLGARIPVTQDEQNTVAHYSLMLDYYTCRNFIPFISANFFTNLSDGTNFPGLRGNGYDVINFGGSNASGTTQGMSALVSVADSSTTWTLVSPTVAAVRPYDLTNNRVTMDMCIRF